MRDEIWMLGRGAALASAVAAIAYLAARDLLHIHDSYMRGVIALICGVVVTAIAPARR